MGWTIFGTINFVRRAWSFKWDYASTDSIPQSDTHVFVGDTINIILEVRSIKVS